MCPHALAYLVIFMFLSPMHVVPLRLKIDELGQIATWGEMNTKMALWKAASMPSSGAYTCMHPLDSQKAV